MKKLLVVLAIAMTIFMGCRMVQAHNLAEYAKNNNCTWISQGTSYGDDRDYICK